MTTVQNKEKYCSMYIQPEEANTPPPQEIQKTLETGKYEDRIKALKQLITNIIHDESYPRMVMTIFNYLLPLQSQSHDMKKVLFFYWEIVEKTNPNGALKDEFILVCNSLRNDLLHPNEYIRGRTLKLLSRVMIRGLLEALVPSIMSNLTHKHSYVRRNAVSCVYAIYLAFKDELLTDIDEHIEKLLKNETDISTKRNAFLLLFNANQQKALNYINDNIINDSSEDTGDIIQLVILELLRKTCKVDPPQKNRLLKAIYFFSKSKSSSVLFECANTLVQISRTPTSLKLAINIYIQLLISNTDNNVKLIVLEKLMHIRLLNPKLLEEQVLEISNILQIKDLDIKKKTLDLMRNLISARNISTIFPILIKESGKTAHATDPSDVEYRFMLLNYFNELTRQFPSVTDELLGHILEYYISYSKLDDNSANEIAAILKNVMNSDNSLERAEVRKHNLCANLGSRLAEMHHTNIIKVVLWILGEFSQDENVESNLNNIKRAIGPLPLEPEKKNLTHMQEEEEQKEKQKAAEKKIKVKTVILPDGTYGTEIVTESDNAKETVDENHTPLRMILINNTYVSSILTTCQMKLLYKLKSNIQLYNKHGSEILLIFCSIVRLYQLSENKIDRELIEKIKTSINLILHPENFLKNKIEWLEPQITQRALQKLNINKSKNEDGDGKARLPKNHVAKQADDLIVIRQLKGRVGTSEVDLSDEEMNEVFFANTKEEEDYTSKLAKTIQLTGYSDPIYAEAFVSIHKYDITFEILLVNRVNKPLQNVSIEFSTQGDLRVVERPQQMVLAPLASAQIKTSIKLSSAEAGLIFASINFENSAGLTQSYMITNEILIDIIDFIYPADISIEEFRRLWSKYEWENRIIINTNIEDSFEYIRHIEKSLKMKCLKDLDANSSDQKFITTNLYAKTKLDDDFLLNISIEKIDNKITGYLRIRSKTKGIVINLGERIKKIQQL